MQKSYSKHTFMRKIIATCCFLLTCHTLYMTAQEVSIIPYPQKVEVSQKLCNIKKLKSIHTGETTEGKEAALLLQEKMKEMELTLDLTTEKRGKGCIELLLTDKVAGKEAYRMEVKKNNVRIEASTHSGLVYGVQSLLQEIKSDSLKCGIIEDEPRFEWRGYLLDESRHFVGEKKVKQILDILGTYKVNRFHWHLTDQPGWRIEIKAYPKLTEIGAIGNHTNSNAPAAFYTQEQIRDIVNYAAQRGIQVVPEIDMPGHAGASNRAYPEFQALGNEQHPDFCFNPGNEGTYTYLTNILKEVTQLFPSPYLHIGGDEVHFGNSNWDKDEHIKRLMTAHNLKNAREVEEYFLERMEGVVEKMGKKTMTWDDTYEEGKNPENNIITWWRHDKTDKLQKMLKEGIPLVLCPRKPLYLDFVQHDSHQYGRRWDGGCPTEDVYAFPESMYEKWGVSEEDMKSVLGIQGNMWGETTQNAQRVEFMTFPRIIAMAEAGWTRAEQKSYDSFQKRMNQAYDYLDKEGIWYFDTRNPDAHAEPDGPKKDEDPEKIGKKKK